VAIAAFLVSGLTAQDASLAPVLGRVTEEAEIFQQNIVKTLTQETLEQSASAPARFQPRVGQKPAKPQMRKHVVLSEYSVGKLKESAGGNLVEYRQVLSVDGTRVQSQASARHALSMNVLSEDDRARKRMLEDFASYGLVDIATDYGLVLLAFTQHGIADMKFSEEPERQVEGTAVRSIAWTQTSTAAGELEFHGRQAARIPLSGRLLVRRSDFLPLRVEVWAEDTQSKPTIRDEATVAYTQSEHGFLMPTSVVHLHLVNGVVTAENRYTYQPFRLFSADTEIEFEGGVKKK
jgi:hypothetical protein